MNKRVVIAQRMLGFLVLHWVRELFRCPNKNIEEAINSW